VDGTTVRCTACDTTWFVASQAITPDALELRDLEEAQQSDVAHNDTESRNIARVPAPAPIGAKDMTANAGKRRSPNAATLYRQQKSETARRGRLRSILAVWLVAMTVLALAAIAAILLRHTVVKHLPAASGVYGAFGLHTTALGLDFDKVTLRFAEVDGTDFLVVEGEVINVSGARQAVPIIELTLVGPGREDLANWSVDPGPGRLAADARRSFISEYPKPPFDARGLRVRFEGEDGETPSRK